MAPMMRSQMPVQTMRQPKKAASKVPKAPKNMGGKLPAAIGKRKTNHGKMNFSAGGKMKY